MILKNRLHRLSSAAKYKTIACKGRVVVTQFEIVLPNAGNLGVLPT